MNYQYFPYQLKFRYPFKIAHTLRETTEVVYLKIEQNGYVAWGESAYPPYVKENPQTFAAFIKKVQWPQNITDLSSLHQYLKQLLKEFPNDVFSITAVDIALHNLLAASSGQTIHSWYGLKNERKPSSYTLGISEKHLMLNKINDAPEATYFKLKVNEEEADRIIEDYKSICHKPFVIDANQGFKDRVKAKYLCDSLYEQGVKYVEQPFDKMDLESHLWLKNNTKMTIIADESFQRFSDLDRIAECFSGINVKLMKSGGLMEAYLSLKGAKEKGMMAMLGCMSESSVAVNAAWEISALADFLDLDGPFLIKNDPFVLGEPDFVH